MAVNKVDSVKTLPLVAREHGRDEEWLFDIAAEMEPEDGLIWVFGPDDDGGAMAFTNDGIECLINLIAEQS